MPIRRVLVLASVLTALTATLAVAQPGTAALDALLRDLGSSDFATRERATAGFLAHGPAARAFLEKAREGLDLEGRLRIDSILSRLEGDETTDSGPKFEPTLVDLDLREVPMGDAARRLGDAAGIPIRYGQANSRGTTPGQGVPVTFAVKRIPFFRALDQFCELTGCTYNGDYASGGFTLNPITAGPLGPVRYVGPLRVAATSLNINRTTRFTGPPTTHANLQIRISVEPHAGVIGLLSPVIGATAEDDRGGAIKFIERGGQRHLQSLAQSNQAYQALSLEPPATEARELRQVKIPLDLVLPAAMVSSEVTYTGSTDGDEQGNGPLALKVDSLQEQGGAQTVTISFNTPIPEGDTPLQTVPSHEELSLYDVKGQLIPVARNTISRRNVGSRTVRSLRFSSEKLGRVRVKVLSRYRVKRASVTFPSLDLP